MDIQSKLEGPVVVVGCSGFVGSYILRDLLAFRSDVYGVSRNTANWRLFGLPSENLIKGKAADTSTLERIRLIAPKTILYLAASGAYPHQDDASEILQINLVEFEEFCSAVSIGGSAPVIVHAGSSSEYGQNSDSPNEEDQPSPNSIYSVSKGAASLLIHYLGKIKKQPICNLRLYSVYGPFEDPGRLIPRVAEEGLKKAYPSLAGRKVGRDFIYVDDVAQAFYAAALKLEGNATLWGESFNIGSGTETTIEEVALASKSVFDIGVEPKFGDHPGRQWDVEKWCANVDKAKAKLDWQARVSFEEGLERYGTWLTANEELVAGAQALSKTAEARRKISAIIACYKDDQAVPIMHDRLVEVFTKIDVDYEIIFVDDCCPSGSAEVIRKVSEQNSRVIGISHSRNFGSQAAFMSGLRMCSGDAAVLLDGDLQDPPSLIEDFHAEWIKGAEVVYGVRVKREMGALTEGMYKGFYWLFSKLTPFTVPRNAGDFSLMDRRVVDHIKAFPEKDLFLRGIRAYAGFKQRGVDYVRPERQFGVSTNNLWKNIEWAKRGIFSFTVFPISLLSLLTLAFGIIFAIFGMFTIISKLFLPISVPDGLTTIILLILFVGGLQLFSIAVIGEYIGKILNETKNRPLFIISTYIRNGIVENAKDHSS